eukprot:762836-Hanusia_phi.AAC.2
MFLKIKLHDGAIPPKRSTTGSACYDVYSIEDKTIPSSEQMLIETGVSVEFPNDYMLQLLSRSGLSFKYGLQVGAGVIDSDYRDTIKVLLYNHGKHEYTVKKGDRIAQMALVQISTPDIEIVETLAESERGKSGFGSSGK